ncbi:MAG TPA: hydrogenase maturation protease [Thermoanaerobaculia bacterium]|nr:hydrogenase maturation protease [Thermoanaerobaculia bacterium]
METGAPLVRVLGLGNVLMGDDALGPWVVHRLLETYVFPPEVSVVDVGTPGLDLVPYVAGPCGIILVDAVRSSTAKPGEIRVYGRDALVKFGPQPRTSPHDPGVTEAILAVEMAGEAPAFVTLVGVVPGRVATGVGMTEPLQEAVATAAETVVGELVARGFDVTVRNPNAVSTPLPWWEVPVIAPVPPPASSPALASAPAVELALV